MQGHASALKPVSPEEVRRQARENWLQLRQQNVGVTKMPAILKTPTESPRKTGAIQWTMTCPRSLRHDGGGGSLRYVEKFAERLIERVHDEGGARRQVTRSSDLHHHETTPADELFQVRPPLRPLARELLRFVREVAWPPRTAKIIAVHCDGGIDGGIAVRNPSTLM